MTEEPALAIEARGGSSVVGVDRAIAEKVARGAQAALDQYGFWRNRFAIAKAMKLVEKINRERDD